jgi:capsular polysaccharide transport system ATP-binding protein
MIRIENIHKGYRTVHGWKKVLKGISLEVPPDVSLGILGRNGAGKSTLIKILSRLEVPDKGRISHPGIRLSWPIGRGGVQSLLTGRDNVRFICRVYGLDIRETTQFVEDFAELGTYLDMPVNTYSAGMRSRLAFAISMASEYDTYLVDEGFSAGDARFTKRMSQLFDERRQRSNMIVVSHSGSIIKRFCNRAAVLEEGHLTVYDSIDEALNRYKNL